MEKFIILLVIASAVVSIAYYGVPILMAGMPIKADRGASPLRDVRVHTAQGLQKKVRKYLLILMLLSPFVGLGLESEALFGALLFIISSVSIIAYAKNH